jgi:hypothetical protein
MSKAILEFNIPEEDEEFKHAKNGIIYSCAIDDILRHFRQIIKYGEDEEKSKWAEIFRDEIYSILKDNDIEL